MASKYHNILAFMYDIFFCAQNRNVSLQNNIILEYNIFDTIINVYNII